ncbi:hypothetical protein CMV_007749 [Castanea mollissima]|uniref:CS domain-containing protein n=1 Tax=Castanea mollissima TaxID=60419 RepID=A0A8J4RNN8_9ROSI|nr:hypothetical protein CMV_007749 [Castanea mollissima]
MNSWRAALTEAAKLAGLHLEPYRPESEFIEEIVENILKKLNEESSTAPSLRQNDAPGQHSSAAIPHNDASSGLDLENYSWTQTLEEVTLNVPVPTGTKSRSVVCEIKKNHLKVGLKGQPPIIDGELFWPVKPDDCYWSIEDQSAISILLTKHDKMERWKSIVKGDPEIDTQKVEPESSKLSDPDPETRQTVEKMMITMSKGYSFLDQISDAKETWRIRVRICRMCKAGNKRSGNNFISLDMILIDEKKNLMHAIVRKNVFQKFGAILHERGTFVISNFKVIVTKKGYRPVSNDLNIIFLLTTSVKECNEKSELIPMHAFEFATYDCINSRLNNNSYLTDIIGKLTAVGPIEQVHFDNGSTNIRNLQILLPEDKELKISLWDESAETITENDFKEDEGPYVIIVTSTIVKEFQGKLNLNTTSASKVYVNLDITQSYKLQIQVNDHTRTTSFVLFDKDAEKIIQKTAMELSSKNQEPNKVPQEIQNLLGKSYTFQIKVDDYNVKEGWEVYTVTSVFKSESNDTIAASDIKLLTSLKDVADDNLIDDVFGNSQMKDLTKKRTSKQTSNNNTGSSQNKKKKK